MSLKKISGKKELHPDKHKHIKEELTEEVPASVSKKEKQRIVVELGIEGETDKKLQELVQDYITEAERPNLQKGEIKYARFCLFDSMTTEFSRLYEIPFESARTISDIYLKLTHLKVPVTANYAYSMWICMRYKLEQQDYTAITPLENFFFDDAGFVQNRLSRDPNISTKYLFDYLKTRGIQHSTSAVYDCKETKSLSNQLGLPRDSIELEQGLFRPEDDEEEFRERTDPAKTVKIGQFDEKEFRERMDPDKTVKIGQLEVPLKHLYQVIGTSTMSIKKGK